MKETNSLENLPDKEPEHVFQLPIVKEIIKQMVIEPDDFIDEFEKKLT